MKKYVSYYRVSTQKQGQSGLGLEAQQHACHAFVAGSGTIVEEFVEVESGKKNQRPQLAAAMAAAKQTKSTLLIAKLDRLSRNASFIFALRDSGVDFVCCDMPDANTLTVGIFAVLAQHEREVTSARTIAALAAKKARGFTLGTPANFTDEVRHLGTLARQAKAAANVSVNQARNLAQLYQEKGYTTRHIAHLLNLQHYKTSRGSEWVSASVSRLLRQHSVAQVVAQNA